ncbi:MAG: hypothetical protein RSD67_06155 [Oscillospiraceae bacterium]
MDEYINSVVEQIVDVVEVDKIILFSKKQDLEGKLSSFKICVIIKKETKTESEKEIYINVDCEIPFDVVVYTSNEWNKLVNEKGSFGNKVNRTGSVIYG